MTKTLSDLLGDGILPPELLASLQEAFDAKIEEAKEQAEHNIREELGRRYENDKEQLVEAMDTMLSDVVTKMESEKAEQVSRLQEAQAKFHQGLKEAKAHYKTKLREHVAATTTFVTKNLAEEVVSYRNERKSMSEQRVRVARDVAKLKEALSVQHGRHVKKIDEFVLKQLQRELNEFDQDRRALVEARVSLAAESRKRLRETQTRFVKESAKKLDSMITGQLVTEMKQLHEDIERNRQNDFGRRMFEAFAAEYMISYFAEGTETRKLQGLLESAQNELKSVKASLVETSRASDLATRKARLAEDRANRSTVKSELLSNLRGEKRAIMEGMLESVPTADLRKTFDRLMPIVCEDRKTPAQAKTPLNEAKVKEARVVTGDQRNNRLIETIQAEAELDTDALHLARLAGIQK